MAGNGAATASMMASASKPGPAPSQQLASKVMANANFSSANPFQQAKQQQLQMQMQKQKQLQMQQQQQQQAATNAAQAQAAANAAAMREQELHRAAQMQFQTQNAAGGRFDEWDDHGAQQGGGEDEVLPDIASEYSDSEDEETIQKRAAMPSWTQGDALDAALLAQSTVDADEIFGILKAPSIWRRFCPVNEQPTASDALVHLLPTGQDPMDWPNGKSTDTTNVWESRVPVSNLRGETEVTLLHHLQVSWQDCRWLNDSPCRIMARLLMEEEERPVRALPRKTAESFDAVLPPHHINNL